MSNIGKGANTAPDLAFQCKPLGHVFLTTDTFEFKIESRGVSVQWTITNFWRDTVASGTLPMNEDKGILTLPDNRGYFLLHLTALDSVGNVIKSQYTSYAIVTPFSPTDRKNSPWGVMTHFAQDMALDVLDPIAKAGITSIRDEHYWKRVESEKGKYVFSEQSNNYMAACKKWDINPKKKGCCVNLKLQKSRKILTNLQIM